MLADVFDQVVRIEITLWNALDARLRADHGLPVARFQVLRAVATRTADGGTCRVQDVAGDLLVTVGGISKLVDRLEAAGLCRRRPNPEDRRSSLLELTDEGADLLALARRSADAALSQCFSALPTGELQRFTATLDALERP